MPLRHPLVSGSKLVEARVLAVWELLGKQLGYATGVLAVACWCVVYAFVTGLVLVFFAPTDLGYHQPQDPSTTSYVIKRPSVVVTHPIRTLAALASCVRTVG